MTKTGITVYGCSPDEAALFRETAPRFDVITAITEAPVSETNIGLALGNSCVSVSHKTPISHSLLRALSQAGIRYISTRSSGYDHIDVEYARELGITVGNVAYSPDSVADYTLMLMLMLARNVVPTIKRGAAHDFRLSNTRGQELRDMTIGVIGTGRIGAAVVERLRGFGGRILAYDRGAKISAEYVSLEELLRQSDIVTLHTPLNADTQHLLNAERIGQMKPQAFVVNTGRGPLLDTTALVAALKNGRLGGAALDVLEGEEDIFYSDCRSRPIKNRWLSELEALPNVIITPHTAYYTEHALADMVENTIINCLEFEKEKLAWIN